MRGPAVLPILVLTACAGRAPAPEAGPAPADVTDPAPEACPRVYLGHPGIASLPALEWAPGEEPRGLDPELAALLGEELGCPLARVEVEGFPPELRWSLLETDQADLSIFQNSVTAERDARVDFTRPYTVDGVGIVVPVDSPARSAADLAEATIVVTAGSTSAAWVEAELPEATRLSQTQDIGEIKACFADGRCDALAGDHSALSTGAWRDARLRLLDGGPLTREPWAVAVAEGDDALRARLDAALAAAEASGALPALRERYGMPAP